MPNIFPERLNSDFRKIFISGGVTCVVLVGSIWYAATPKTLNQGYQPAQPIPYSHKLHVGELKMDCRFCHSYVEYSGMANVPTGETCWECHKDIKRTSPKLEPLRRSLDPSFQNYTGEPVKWSKVHILPDFVAFNHSSHVTRGIGCQSCHGDIPNMEVVSQRQSLSMAWCLECHRNPAPNLRPLEFIYAFDFNVKTWQSSNLLKNSPAQLNSDKSPKSLGEMLEEQWKIYPRQNCNTCHQ